MVERNEPPGEPSLRREPGWLGQNAGLTERESEVLLLCANGLTNREIAQSLYVNIETVRSHLKRAYQRLGVRNRAQAAVYVQRVLSSGPDGPDVWLGHRPVAPTAVAGPGARSIEEMDPVAIADRLALLGLSDEARHRLLPYRDAAVAGVDGYARRQIQRWRALPDTARILHDDRVMARLIQHQRSYVHDLFAAPYDQAHVAAMLETGATHHRLHLQPQYYLASCAHVVADHLPLILGPGAPGGGRGEAAVEAVIALFSSVLFDASLILDGYEIALTTELADSRPTDPPATGSPADPAPAPPPPTPRPLARVSLTPEDAPSRRFFVGLGDTEIERIHALGPAVAVAMPSILAEFYTLLSRTNALAPLVPPEVVDRLLGSVERFWAELTASRFDAAYTASRLRVGVVHERIGLSPQLYLAGLALQVSDLLRAVAGAVPDPLPAFDALLRAVFFDLTFMLDAYLDARANALLQISRFAGQVVAGLANGLAVVDQRNRIEFANDQLLAIVDVPPGVLHRLPLSSALPLAGIDDLVATARTGPSGRSAALYDLNGARYRVTAVRLDNLLTSQDGLVALVVDDISELMHAAATIGHEQNRLDHVLSVVPALVWEMRRDDHTVLAASSGAPVVVGQRDVDLLGRPSLVDHVDRADRTRFVAVCRSLGTGQRAEISHGLRRDGELVRAHTSMVATVDPLGLETLCGVTVLLGG